MAAKISDSPRPESQGDPVPPSGLGALCSSILGDENNDDVIFQYSRTLDTEANDEVKDGTLALEDPGRISRGKKRGLSPALPPSKRQKACETTNLQLILTLPPTSPASSLSSSLDPDLDDDTITSKPYPDDLTPDSQCPWCGKPVDKDYFQKSAGGSRMAWSEQQDFCNMHKKEEARIEWEEWGFPEIDWSAFNERILLHYGHIEGILEGKLTQDIEPENFSPGKYEALHGYYGPRGVRAIEDLSATFSDLFKRLKDKSAFRGPFYLFIQDVLVPELLMRLVKEDMGLDEGDEQGARGILEAGQELGALLCEEQEDIVDLDDPNLF